MNHNARKAQYCFSRFFKILSHVYFIGILNKFAYFSHAVGETFQLKGNNFGDSVELVSFSGIASIFAVLAKIFVASFEFVDGEEACETVLERACSLALLIRLAGTILKS